MKLPWHRVPKQIGAEHVTFEPIDCVARRVLAPYRQDFMSHADLRQRRDDFEGLLEELRSGAKIQIRVSDRKQIQKIFATLAVVHGSLKEPEAIALASWVLDLRPSTVEHFFKEWLAEYAKKEEERVRSGIRFRIAALTEDDFVRLAERLIEIERDEA
jgi:hypothetical protein